MALLSIRRLCELDEPFVLAPERYDPRREFSLSSSTSTLPLRTVVELNRKTLTGPNGDAEHCLIFDTGDAHEGVISGRRQRVPMSAIGSAKKEIRQNDVIISRLRPYLRQVAFVDTDVPCRGEGVIMLCSTEFFVLRPTDHQSIAFLVPFLLTGKVQKVLAASQEGGHHPRFSETSLLSLLIPAEILERREEISKIVESSVQSFRQSQREMAGVVEITETVIER